MRRLVIVLVSMLALTVAGLAAGVSAGARPAPAVAARTPASTSSLPPIELWWDFRNLKTNRCMHAHGYVSVGACDGSLDQLFAVRPIPNYRYFESSYGGCFTDSGLRPYITTCTEADNQKWALLHFSNGLTGFKNKATGRCLDDTEANGLRTWTCNGTIAQQWYVVAR